MNIDSQGLISLLDYKELAHTIKEAFSSYTSEIPDRMHLNLGDENIALVMPAWDEKYYGIKQVFVCPHNGDNELPIIQGRYDLYIKDSGVHLASIDAPSLTAFRTAATSVLASSILKSKAKNLLVMGSGVIAAQLVAAYHELYDLKQITIWSRNHANAERLAHKFDYLQIVNVSSNLRSEVAKADIISCATHAYEPILKGKWIKGNPHIDLVGSYKPSMREVDDAAISMSQIYIDDYPAMKESGDLLIPLKSGIISKDSIAGTLRSMSSMDSIDVQPNQPTLFKSVGHAIEDLAAAIYFYEKFDA